jgi:hypothetical protein
MVYSDGNGKFILVECVRGGYRRIPGTGIYDSAD